MPLREFHGGGAPIVPGFRTGPDRMVAGSTESNP